jgi:hypothetical protein
MSNQQDTTSSDLIDQIGSKIVADHFGLSRQRLHMWRVRGIPHLKRVAFQNLASQHGVTPPADFLARLFTAKDAEKVSA